MLRARSKANSCAPARRQRQRRFGAGALALWVVLACSAAARADAPSVEARALFEDGQARYERGDFAGAADAFRRSHALSGEPELLYDLYLAERDRHALPEAADALRRYLADADDLRNRPQLEARLDALDRAIAEERDRADADGRGRAHERAARDPVAAPPRWWRAGAFTAGAGGVLMATALPTGLSALALSRDLDRKCPMDECSGDLASDVDRKTALARATDVLLFSGLAATLTGVVLLLTRRPRERPPDAYARALRVDAGPFGVAFHF